MTEYTPIGTIIIEYLTFCVMCTISVFLVKRWFQRRNRTLLWLTISFIVQSIASFSSATGRLINTLLYEEYKDAPESLTHPFTIIAYILTPVAGIFALWFARNVFFPNHERLPLIFTRVITLAHCVLGCLFTIELLGDTFGTHPEQIHIPWTSIVLSFGWNWFLYGLLIVVLIQYSVMAFWGFWIARNPKERYIRWALRILGLYALVVIVAFVFFALEVRAGYYSVFYYLAWISLFSSIILAYIGYIMPPWFVNLFQSKT